jgi:hypothetical protein
VSEEPGRARHVPDDRVERPCARLFATRTSPHTIGHQEEKRPGAGAEPLALLDGNAGRLDLDRSMERRNQVLVLVLGADAAHVAAAERIDSGAIDGERKYLADWKE